MSIGNNVAAFFDVDGTLLKGNIVNYYAQLRLLGLAGLQRTFWKFGFLFKVPIYILVDKFSRRRFAEILYWNYRHLTPDQLEERSQKLYSEHMEPRIYPSALRCVREHQARSHQVVLVTGSLDTIVGPLATKLHATEVLCCRLQTSGNSYTGRLVDGPLTDERKGEAIRHYALEHHLDLQRCYAYADSLDDIRMLEQVGHPHVINPGRKLSRIAQKKGWEILRWTEADPVN